MQLDEWNIRVIKDNQLEFTIDCWLCPHNYMDNDDCNSIRECPTYNDIMINSSNFKVVALNRLLYLEGKVGYFEVRKYLENRYPNCDSIIHWRLVDL